MAKAKSVPMPMSESVSVSVRKIDNGYIVSRSRSDAKGYSCTETFSPTKPRLDLPAPPVRKATRKGK